MIALRKSPVVSVGHRDAVLSHCGTYRFQLTRHLAGAENQRSLLFVMLNPSIANADIDDPTIRKCMGFAKLWGFGIVEVGNLFAYRATDPKQLIAEGKAGTNVEGLENDGYLENMIRFADQVVVAWGTKGTFQSRAQRFAQKFADVKPLWALRVTKDGHPEHPLYIPYDTQLVRWGLQ